MHIAYRILATAAFLLHWEADGSSVTNPLMGTPSPSSHRNILTTKLQVPCLNYCFLVPRILQLKIHKKPWETAKSSPFLIYLQTSLSLYTSKRGNRTCLPYWFRLGTLLVKERMKTDSKRPSLTFLECSLASLPLFKREKKCEESMWCAGFCALHQLPKHKDQ